MTSILQVGLNRTRILNGVLAGLAGGLAFGTLMGMMGMMAMVAMLVGSTSAGVGWVLHLLISAAFGAALGVLVAPRSWNAGLLAGVAWGVVLWAGAAMVVMRLTLGMPIALDPPAMMSLMGHAVFGAIAGLVLAWRTRATTRDERATAAA